MLNLDSYEIATAYTHNYFVPNPNIVGLVFAEIDIDSYKIAYRSEMFNRTRHFFFTRVNPTARDYDLLVKTCEKIDGFLRYRTVIDKTTLRVRLTGIIILRGPCTIVQDLERLFPNFVLTAMVGRIFDRMDEKFKPVKVFGDHPFFEVKKELFPKI